MPKNYFARQVQTVPIELFNAKRSDKSNQSIPTINAWKIHPVTAKRTLKPTWDSSLTRSVLSLRGTTYIQLPDKDPDRLGLTQGFLCLQMFSPVGTKFSLQLNITDNTNTPRRLHLSTAIQHIPSDISLNGQAPLNIGQGAWLNFVVDIPSFCQGVFRTGFSSLDRIQVHANCDLARALTLPRPPVHNLPVDAYSSAVAYEMADETAIPRTMQLPPSVGRFTQIYTFDDAAGLVSALEDQRHGAEMPPPRPEPRRRGYDALPEVPSESPSPETSRISASPSPSPVVPRTTQQGTRPHPHSAGSGPPRSQIPRPSAIPRPRSTRPMGGTKPALSRELMQPKPKPRPAPGIAARSAKPPSQSPGRAVDPVGLGWESTPQPRVSRPVSGRPRATAEETEVSMVDISAENGMIERDLTYGDDRDDTFESHIEMDEADDEPEPRGTRDELLESSGLDLDEQRLIVAQLERELAAFATPDSRGTEQATRPADPDGFDDSLGIERDSGLVDDDDTGLADDLSGIALEEVDDVVDPRAKPTAQVSLGFDSDPADLPAPIRSDSPARDHDDEEEDAPLQSRLAGLPARSEMVSRDDDLVYLSDQEAWYNPETGEFFDAR
ncbi:signal recognition particle protein SRP54 [Carpediemonas membranifera]|uniref:Signal recognition particle protein SRP54 n=1 Tax=Carpediemonas membranifera TaxID=201153 RepID=A0A8J6E528_9EUKA|nr:signal recognition particle protein SRP54 [Carpediemonas membranifera]|eukprot:KAG9395227.1 signal recognition particle protein SRP54 [Carpediemonas membranifera]